MARAGADPAAAHPAGADSAKKAERRFSDAEVRAYAAMLGDGRKKVAVKSSADLFPPVKGDVFTGIRQGAAGNCVSVAAIKAAMTAFGPDRVFKSIEKRGDGLDIRMRDDKRVHLSTNELNEAAAGSRFHGSDRGLLRRAIVMYAAMAKRAQIEGNDGQRNMSFRRAMGTLNDGEQIREGAHWLGLDKSVRSVGPRDAGRYAAVVSANNSHAVFTTRGVQDWYGSARRGGWMGSAFALVDTA